MRGFKSLASSILRFNLAVYDTFDWTILHSSLEPNA